MMSDVTMFSLQDPHPLRLRAPGVAAEVWQQPQDSVQRGLQQVRLELRPEERRGVDQRLAAVVASLHLHSTMNNCHHH